MLVRGGRRGRSAQTRRPSVCYTQFCCVSSSLQGTHTPISALTSHLRWCARSQAIQEGMACHHYIIKQNLHRNPFLLNLLLHFYGECAALDAADALFALCPRDVFSYNFMIVACARAGHHIKALHLFYQMHLEAVMPDRVTYAALASVLASLSFLDAGRFLHACILQCMHVSVATAIIHMYGKCGSLHDAQMTFQRIHARDVVAWNCILGVHVDHHMGQEALMLYEQMELEGVAPDKVTFISLISACANTSDLLKGEHVHIDVISRGFESDTVVGNALVSMYAKSHCLESAWLVFERLSARNVVTWNTIIGAHTQTNDGSQALNLLDRMQEEGVEPNKITFLSTISASPPQDALVFFDIINGGDVMLWNALISTLSKHKQHAGIIQFFYQMQLEGVLPNKITFLNIVSVCSSEQALIVGKRMHALVAVSGHEHDSSLGNAMIDMYHNCDCLEHAESTFSSMLDRTVVTWTIMASVLTRNKKWAEAVQFFDRMLLEGLVPDKFFFASALDTCVSLISFAEGKRIHTRILAAKFSMDVVLGTALLNMYGECGSLNAAKGIFDQLCEQNTISHNAIIAAYAHHGRAHRSIDLFEQMNTKGIASDSSTFLGLLTACSHSGLLREGVYHFCSMQSYYGLLPSMEHYDCIIDLLGRAGQLMEAEYLISNMHVNPTAITYRTLLSACRNSADVVCAFSQAFNLEPENEGSYFLLSNMYATILSSDDIS